VRLFKLGWVVIEYGCPLPDADADVQDPNLPPTFVRYLRVKGNKIRPLEIKEEKRVGSQLMQEERTMYGRDHFSANFKTQVHSESFQNNVVIETPGRRTNAGVGIKIPCIVSCVLSLLSFPRTCVASNLLLLRHNLILLILDA